VASGPQNGRERKRQGEAGADSEPVMRQSGHVAPELLRQAEGADVQGNRGGIDSRAGESGTADSASFRRPKSPVDHREGSRCPSSQAGSRSLFCPVTQKSVTDPKKENIRSENDKFAALSARFS